MPLCSMYFHSAGAAMTLEAESFHPQPTSTLASTTVDIPGKLVTYIWPSQFTELKARSQLCC